MNCISFNYHVDMWGWQFQPLGWYVVSKWAFDKTLENFAQQGIADAVNNWSGFNSYERRYSGHELKNGARLAIYRERGIGDSLMVTGLTRWIKENNPAGQIDIYSMPSTRDAWHGNKDVNYIPQPPMLDGLRDPKCLHLFFEGMIESNLRKDQACAYDDFLAFSGYNSQMVPSEFKRPHISWTPQDQLNLGAWREQRKHERYVLWHWCPSGMNRMYPPELSEQAIRLIAEQFHVIICGTLEPDCPPPAIDHPNVRDAIGATPTFRHVLPLVRDAACVVGPDSCMIHAAGAFPDVPAVAMWGPFGSDSRVKYYRNVLNLTTENVCPHMPCNSQYSALPRNLCADVAGYRGDEQKWCRVMESIPPERVAQAVLKHAR